MIGWLRRCSLAAWLSAAGPQPLDCDTKSLRERLNASVAVFKKW